jgi:hypothetical protein
MGGRAEASYQSKRIPAGQVAFVTRQTSDSTDFTDCRSNKVESLFNSIVSRWTDTILRRSLSATVPTDVPNEEEIR